MRRMLAEESEKRNEEIEIYIPPGPRLGNVVIEANNVSKAYGDIVLFEGLNLPSSRRNHRRHRSERSRQNHPVPHDHRSGDSRRGSIRIGETVKLAMSIRTVPLIRTRRIWQEISGGEDSILLGKREVNSRAYVARFNFSGTDQQKKTAALSGGERNRVHLAKVLREEQMFYCWMSRRTTLTCTRCVRWKKHCSILPAAPLLFPTIGGSWTASQLTSSLLKGTAKCVWYDGNYTEYEADRRKRLGIEADRPHRIQVQEAHARVRPWTSTTRNRTCRGDFPPSAGSST